MSSDTFRFKQFTIRQSASAMKVGTDSIILGSWVNLTGSEQRILDAGAGTGQLALMMGQRTPAARIDAVEIEPGAAQEAVFNVNQSPWADRINITADSFQNFAAAHSDSEKYDLIISNPPYFIGSPTGHLRASSVQRIAARHAELLPYDELIDGVLKLLSPEGRFAAIFPYQESGVFIAKAAIRGLFCNRVLEIVPKPGRPVKRIAAEFSRHKDKPVAETLIIANEDKDFDFTEQYRNLTSDFYLYF